VDDYPVTGESSPIPEFSSLADMLTNICPAYMAMGMTYNQFWYSNTKVHKAYREAYEIKKKNDEWARWRHVAYIYDTLLRVSPVFRSNTKGRPEPGKYPEEPWPLTEKEYEEAQERREKERYERYIAKMEADSARELKRRAKEAREEASEDGEHR